MSHKLLIAFTLAFAVSCSQAPIRKPSSTDGDKPSCQDTYRSVIRTLEDPIRQAKERRKQIATAATSLATSAPLALGSLGVGFVLFATSSELGSAAIMLIAGGVGMGASAVDNSIDITKPVNPEDAIADMKAALDLIAQAYSGDGTDLRQLTEEINARCTGPYDQPLSKEIIANIITKADSSDHFCPAPERLYTSGSIKYHAMMETGRSCK